MSDKWKYKKDSFTGKNQKVWSKCKPTEMSVNVAGCLAADYKGLYDNQQTITRRMLLR